MAKESVVLKGYKNGINIILDKEAEFITISQHLRQKVAGARNFFVNANARISFRGRKLTEDEERILLKIISDEAEMAVSYPEEQEYETQAPAVIERTTPSASPRFKYSEQQTAFYQSGLRSGQEIRYNGSVVVMGDVNAGSEIIAGGNVIVMGALKGMVHAGSDGNDQCFIYALYFQPTQMRIAGTISYIPEDEISNLQDNQPSCAYIKNGQIYIAPLHLYKIEQKNMHK